MSRVRRTIMHMTRGTLFAAALLLMPAVVAQATEPEPTRLAVIKASEPTQEPDVWRDGDTWKMLYTQGWEHAALAFATAPTASGPWTQHGRILGLGFGGYQGNVSHFSVSIFGGRPYVYFPDFIDGGNTLVATGPNLRHLTVREVPALTGTGIANTSVVKDGDTYRMMFDAKVDDPSWWNMGYATAKSPLGPFQVQAFPLPSLQHHTDSMYGGGDLHRVGNHWVLWYHAARDGNTTLPTDIYRATSRDLINWTPTDQPVITREAPEEVDQVADPVFVVTGKHGTGRLFWSAQNNLAPTGAVMVNDPHTMPLTR